DKAYNLARCSAAGSSKNPGSCAARATARTGSSRIPATRSLSCSTLSVASSCASWVRSLLVSTTVSQPTIRVGIKLATNIASTVVFRSFKNSESSPSWIAAQGSAPSAGRTEATPAPKALQSSVRKSRNLLAHLRNQLLLNLGHGDSFAVRSLRDPYAPGIPHHRVPVADSLLRVTSHLRRGQYVALVFDGPRPQQNLPMVLSGGQRERRWNRQGGGA